MTGAAGRTVEVAPERLARWLDGFAQRHGGPLVWEVAATNLVATARDGARADCAVPFPPLPAAAAGTDPGTTDPAAAGPRASDPLAVDPHDTDPQAADPPAAEPRACNSPATDRLAADPQARLVAHALVERRVGVLLVRLGGYAAGVFRGVHLESSKVGSRPVHGRNAAGGQSQQRFARRREGQVRVALAEAADVAARILAPVAGDLDAMVVGGDRRAVTAVLGDRRLARLQPLVQPRLLDVPDPRLRVLLGTAAQFRAVQIRVIDPPPS